MLEPIHALAATGNGEHASPMPRLETSRTQMVGHVAESRRSGPAGLVLTVALIQLAHLIYFDPFVGTYGDTAGYVALADTIFGWPFFAIYYQPLYPAFLRVSALLVALDVRITIYEYLLLTEILAVFLSVFLHPCDVVRVGRR